MTKIGLYLGAEPQQGGSFQYSQAVLDAICSLSALDISVVIAGTSECWREYVSSYDVREITIPNDYWTRNFDRPRFINPPVRAVRSILPHICPMAKAVVSERCDLWVFPSQDVWSYQFPVPSLVAVHDLMHRYERRFPEVSVGGEYRMREWRYRNICRWSKGILVDSEVGKRHVEESYKYPSDRIFVLPFIAPSYYGGSTKTSRNFDFRYQLPSKFVFYPAQFWLHKNHAGLIRAIDRLKISLPDLKCVMAGSRKNGYQSTIDLIREKDLKNNILLLDYVPQEDIPEFYRRARALVMPTFFGPTNIPPLEAFASGCPVVTSRIYGIPEQVGDAAVLFDPESVDDIAKALRQVWLDDELCENLRRKGFQKIEQWNRRQFNDRLKTIIEGLIRQSQ